jgi:hypothetical protein
MSISQDLKPTVQDINNKKYFCFDMEQSKFLAKRLAYGLSQDLMIDTLQLRDFRWQYLTKKKDSIIFKLERKVENLLVIKLNDDIHLKEQNLTIKKQNKRIKQGKLERWLFGGGLLVLTGIIIAQ